MLARDDEIGRAHDAVPHGLAGAVAVVEHVLAVGLVDHHHREAQLPLPRHDLQTVDAGGRLLTAADDLGDQVGIFRVHEVHKVPAVVDDDVRRTREHAAEAFLILLHRAAVKGKDVHPVRSQRGGHVVLRRERVRARDVHLRPAHLEHAAQIGRLRFQMDGERHAQTFKGSRPPVLFAQGAEHGHIALYPIDLDLARGSEGNVGNSAHGMTSTHFSLYFITAGPIPQGFPSEFALRSPLSCQPSLPAFPRFFHLKLIGSYSAVRHPSSNYIIIIIITLCKLWRGKDEDG